MTPLLIIDGYNVMHAAGLTLGTYKPGELAECRAQLLRLLASRLSVQQRRRTSVVFDATDPAVPDSLPTRIHGMLVLFAPGSGDADELIERMIRDHSAPRSLCVISGDRRLRRAARRRRSQSVDGDTFLRLLASRDTRAPCRAPGGPPQKATTRLSGAELQYWMEVFADVDPNPLAEDVSAANDLQTAPEVSADKRVPARRRHTHSSSIQPPQDDSPLPLDEIEFWEHRLSDVLKHQDRDND